MSETMLVLRSSLPALVTSAGERARILCFEFFASNIRNPNTRQVCAHAAGEFMTWGAQAGVTWIVAVQPLHVACQDQATDADVVGAHRPAKPRGDSPLVRLALHRQHR